MVELLCRSECLKIRALMLFVGYLFVASKDGNGCKDECRDDL